MTEQRDIFGRSPLPLQGSADGTLRLGYHPDGLEVLQADECVEFADEFIEALSRLELWRDTLIGRHFQSVTLGDGILTIRAVNRTVSYGLGKRDLQRMTVLGHRSG